MVDAPTNRIIAVDCSGSMYSELPKLRQHLKNKLPTMVQPQDTLSIVWFSSRGQYGVLFEGVKIDTLQDLSKINSAIDRFLVPTGLTGFKEPLEEVLEMSKRLGGDCTLSFMTDGFDNQWSKPQIMKACADLGDKMSAITFVEYGYYADHSMIVDMAEEVGGSVVLSENFSKYSEELDASMKASVSGKKIKLTKITAPFVIGNTPDTFVIAKPDAVGTVTLPANTRSYSILEGTGSVDNLNVDGADMADAAYAVSALILRGQGDAAMEIAALIGDEPLYKQVENSFSKQDFAISVALANSYAAGKRKLFEAGRKTNLIPDPGAYNVLTLLMDLSATEGNTLNLSHPDFEYNSIGDSRVTAVDDNGFKPVFTDNPGDVMADIMSLSFNEDRPNVSILVKRDGVVTVPENDLGFKGSVDSFVWRNYAIVKDGIVNMKKLPVVLTKKTYDHLAAQGVALEPFKVNKTMVIDLVGLPIINRNMAQPGTARELFDMYFDVYVLKTKQKVLGSLIEKPAFGKGFTEKYGAEGAAFLKNLGISEGGFSPKTVKGETIDAYVSKVLEVKMAGLSTIPKVADVAEALKKGKPLTPSLKIMSDVIDALAGVTDYESVLKGTKIEIKTLMNEIVKVKFGIILGKKMPSDVTNPEETSQEIDFGLGKLTKCSFILADKEI